MKTSFERDRDAMNKAAARLLQSERKAGNDKITHDQIKRRIVEAVQKKNR